MKNYKLYSFITGLFVASLLIANTLDSKIFTMWGLTLPAGIIIFPIVYLFGDILTEVYGYTASRKVIWTGFISLIFMVTTYEIAGMLPSASFWGHQEAFDIILGNAPRIAIASMTAYFIGEFCNSFVLAKLKVRTGGHGMGLRFVMSTIVGEGVDTIIFVLIAFTGIFPNSELLQVILSAWAVKVAWEVIALPLTLPIVQWLKKIEQEDYFDKHTNFNPFRI